MQERCSLMKLQERSEQLLTSETSKRVYRAIPTQIKIATTLTIRMRENSSPGLLLFSLKTSSPKHKSITFGKTREECFNQPISAPEDLARTSQLREDIGSAHTNSGKTYFYHTTEAAHINTSKSTTNWPEFGTLSKRIFRACTERWQAQPRTISKTLDTLLQEYKKSHSKRSSLTN